MLQNNEIIEKLTTKQKIALLTDSLETVPELRNSEIPMLEITELKSDTLDENNEAIFPSFSSVANSWDAQLFGNVVQAQAKLSAKDGPNLFILPKTNAAQSVYGEEITEDPYLAGKLFAGATQCLTKSGASVCMQAPTVSKNDIGVMDITADQFVLFERVARPFKMAKEAGSYAAVLKTQDDIDESYQIANQRMINATVESDKAVITKLESGDNTVSTINQGSLVIGGSSVALETAYDNYKRIYRSMEEGGATAHELEMAILDGAAISDEIIDNVLDQKLTLAKKCTSGNFNKVIFGAEALAEESTKKSIVLVKNNANALPLKKGTRVSLFGDIILNGSGTHYVDFVNKISSSLAASGIDVIGCSRGYVLDEDVSKEEIEPACQIAASSDVAIVFLGYGKEREGALEKTHRLALPANQIA
ncbi:MAG: glycoside hydrolase family 3 C-terminal domain-containing protein [Clostridia bacterium]|nr:glycoside hydrolase family 3 C-terminal domain-containing protein [Clostridia bacterium]